MTNEEIWQPILAQIRSNVSPAIFATWFKSTYVISIEGGEATIAVPNLLAKEWLEQKYRKQTIGFLRSHNESVREVFFRVVKEPPPKTEKIKSANGAISGGQLGFDEFKFNKDTNLNPKYDFDCFIVGLHNELAHAAAVAVAEKPGENYNPLFIYGGVGLGKTHLLQAIGNEVIARFKNKKVRYIPMEKLTSEIITAIRGGTIETLRAKYLDTAVFIVDDVQFISGKERTQDEFFYIFNTLYNKNLQIVLSSDRAPKAIPEISNRLRSRFEGGMIADVSLPDFETRVAILKTKCQQLNISFSDEILSIIASSVQSNIRELEGALTKLAAHAKFKNVAPTMEVCQTILSSINPKKIINVKKIIQDTVNFYDIKEKDILSDSRKKEIVKPRQVIMYLLREEMKSSFPFIGRKMGDKDHTTVMHAYKKISNELKENETFKEEINLLKQKIYNS
ncbi:MAG: chromosomal replication initiator protein DnaA [Candidatus Nealsonbacteria bacterium DGGOD1a]|jgi:chromosomal replication initiator protein DnaA|nr:MAG: chromosomal replication initiator protein DnaA [Candidatus Nealsonbacteria bacterium DGGOD1a]